ncbi:MAG: hypothetical protein WA705_16460 [Candidatus Ozemobacteraceae bacterium]
MILITPCTARRLIPFLLFFFCADLTFGAIASVPVRKGKGWSESANTRILTVTDDAGKTIFTRIWNKKTGKPLSALPDGEKPMTASETEANAIAEASAATATRNALVKSDQAKKTSTEAPKKSSASWSGRAEFGVLFSRTSDDKTHAYREQYNQKDGFGLQSLDLTRVGDRRFFRLRGTSFGMWNSSYGTEIDFRDQAQLHIKARFTRTDYDFGTVLDPSTLRDRFSLDAGLDRPEMRFHPRITLNFRGSESSGDALRMQGSTDQLFPRDRLAQTWHPSNQDFTLGLFGGEKRLDAGLIYGEQTNGDSASKVYRRDFDFNGVSDLLQTWRMQDNFTKSVTGKLGYRFSDSYAFSATITTTSTDNSFDTFRSRSENGNLTSNAVGGDLHGRDHGWLDGWSRSEEYSFEGHPNDLWDFQTTLERRQIRSRGEGSIRETDGCGTLASVDESSTYNKIDEGYYELRADYKGLKSSRAYAGYSVLDREELDDDLLQTFAYSADGSRAPIPAMRAEDRYTIFNETEKMGFLGMWHRFASTLDLDVRHESGSLIDNNRGGTGTAREAINKGHDRTRQRLTLRARPGGGLSLSLKLARTDTNRKTIDVRDERKTAGLYAAWAPSKARFSLGGGYSRTSGDIRLYETSFSDRIDTISVNGGYEISKALRADINLAQTVSGGITSLDHRTGELRLRWIMKHGRDASLGYSERAFENRDLTTENFTNRLFFLSYGLAL